MTPYYKIHTFPSHTEED